MNVNFNNDDSAFYNPPQGPQPSVLSIPQITQHQRSDVATEPQSVLRNSTFAVTPHPLGEVNVIVSNNNQKTMSTPAQAVPTNSTELQTGAVTDPSEYDNLDLNPLED